jgi:uncharacterized membrane-anchored protein
MQQGSLRGQVVSWHPAAPSAVAGSAVARFGVARPGVVVALVLAALAGGLFGRPAVTRAQTAPKGDKTSKDDWSGGDVKPAAGEAKPSAGDSDARSEAAAKMNAIKWTVGPATVDVGRNASLRVPAGYKFTGSEGALAWAELNGNTSRGQLGVLTPPFDLAKGMGPEWFVVFRFDDIGYVKDDEKADLTEETADKILKGVREGNDEANKERQARGWGTLNVTGWHQKPFYDSTTKNLTWAIAAESDGETVVNYDSRALGRHGVMIVKMVVAQDKAAATIPAFQSVIKGLSFKSGESHAEFKSGDKIAEYGLIGLVSGGAAVAVVKWWKPLMKFGVLILVGIGAALKKVVGLFKGNRTSTT